MGQQTPRAYRCKPLKIVIFFHAVLALLACHAASADTPGKLEDFLQRLDTFSAVFEQVLTGAAGEQLERSSGVVYLKRPGMFRWAYRQPYAQQLISDGRTLWIYDEDLEQVSIHSASEMIRATPAAILSGDVALDEHYVMLALPPEEGIPQDGIQWLELTPRDIDSQYRALQLGFKGQAMVSMILFDQLGQKTRIDFKNPSLNPALKRQQFQFSPPAGIDIIDNRHGNQGAAQPGLTQ